MYNRNSIKKLNPVESNATAMNRMKKEFLTMLEQKVPFTSANPAPVVLLRGSEKIIRIELKKVIGRFDLMKISEVQDIDGDITSTVTFNYKDKRISLYRGANIPTVRGAGDVPFKSPISVKINTRWLDDVNLDDFTATVLQ